MADKPEAPKPKNHRVLHDKNIDDLLKEYQGFHSDAERDKNEVAKSEVWDAMYGNLKKHLEQHGKDDKGKLKLRGYNGMPGMDKYKWTEDLVKKIFSAGIEAHHGAANVDHYIKDEERFKDYVEQYLGKGGHGRLIKALAEENDLITAFRKGPVADLIEKYLNDSSSLERKKDMYEDEMETYREHEHEKIRAAGDKLLAPHKLRHKPGIYIGNVIKNTHAQYGTGTFKPKKNEIYEALPAEKKK